MIIERIINLRMNSKTISLVTHFYEIFTILVDGLTNHLRIISHRFVAVDAFLYCKCKHLLAIVYVHSRLAMLALSRNVLSVFVSVMSLINLKENLNENISDHYYY